MQFNKNKKEDNSHVHQKYLEGYFIICSPHDVQK